MQKSRRQRRDFSKRKELNRSRQSPVKYEEVKIPVMQQEKVMQTREKYGKKEKVLTTISVPVRSGLKPVYRTVLKKIKTKRISLMKDHPEYPHPKSKKWHPKKETV